MSDSPLVKSDDTTTESNSQPNDQPEQPDESTNRSSTSSKTPRAKDQDAVAEKQAEFLQSVPTSLVNRTVAWVEAAGSPTEASTKRDGFMSYKSESHAAAMGIAAGWYYGAVGDTKLLSLVYGAAIYGSSYGQTGQRARLFKDIVQEPHYALAGVVVGATLGGSAGRALRFSGVDVISLFEGTSAIHLFI